MQPKISIITPWHNCPELIPTYRNSVRGAEVIIVDNASDPDTAVKLQEMCQQLHGHYIRNEHNAKYAAANNQGAAVATGDIIVFLNNDIEAAIGWLDRVAAQVHDGAIYGPSKPARNINGRNLDYIEGYCIAATRATWESLGWWDAENYTGMYWEDNDVCFRAMQAGYNLILTGWSVWHYSNYTSRKTNGAYDSSRTNEATFIQLVRNAALEPGRG